MLGQVSARLPSAQVAPCEQFKGASIIWFVMDICGWKKARVVLPLAEMTAAHIATQSI
jgi:hypothetical protein